MNDESTFKKMNDSLSENTEKYVPDRRKEKRLEPDRRKHARAGFTYPVTLKIFSRNVQQAPFNGKIADISISGARIQFEDRYGRINAGDLTGSKTKVTVQMPTGENIAIFSSIKWIRNNPSENFIVSVGLEFQEIQDWHLKAIKQLIAMKNKDQNMMWNLFESYEKQL